MTRTHAILAVAALLLVGALVLGRPPAVPVVDRTSPPPIAPPIAPAGSSTPAATGAPGRLDGLYFLGAGRRLTLSRGRFELADAAAPEQSIHGTVQVNEASSAFPENQLFFTSVHLLVRCAWKLTNGRVTVSDAAPVNDVRPCHLLFRGPYDDLRPDASSWTLELGPVGLTPFPGASGIGFWIDGAGGRMQLVAGPEPAREPFRFDRHPPRQLHWDPDESGVVFELFPVNHMMNHVDTDEHHFWVMTGPDTALHVSSGGCNSMADEVRARTFRRATPAEFAAAAPLQPAVRVQQPQERALE